MSPSFPHQINQVSEFYEVSERQNCKVINQIKNIIYFFLPYQESYKRKEPQRQRKISDYSFSDPTCGEHRQ